MNNQYKSYETELEKILSRGLGLDKSQKSDSLFDMTTELSIYLNNGAENLTLSQYKKIRNIVDNQYKNIVSAAVRSGNLDFAYVDRVGRLFTGYLRDQHYRLWDMDKSERDKPLKSEEVKIKPQKLFVQEGYDKMPRSEWAKNDRMIHEFERKSYGREEYDVARGYKFLPKTKEELENSINSKALNKYNLFSLKRIKDKIFNPFKSTVESAYARAFG